MNGKKMKQSGSGKMSIERRISALESRLKLIDASLKFVFVAQGETTADAMKREGYLPDVSDVMCVIFV